MRPQESNPDENLLVAVGDALPILAQALGADAYAPVFAQQHADALFKWLRPSQPDSVRASATGAQGAPCRNAPTTLPLTLAACVPLRVWSSCLDIAQ